MSKALIVYGTRYGAAASTSEEIAKILRQEGLEVRVVNAKEEKIKDIAEYDLVIVGSGIQFNKWTGEPEDFLKKFQKELGTKESGALRLLRIRLSGTKRRKTRNSRNSQKEIS